MYELRCLGEASLRTASGDLVHFRSRKHLALLIYLALNDERAHRRERLAGLLWADTDPSRARHSLSQALYAIRGRLGDAVRIEGEDLELHARGLTVDAVQMQERLTGEDPLGACELYRGEFLEGFWVRGAQEFEEWADRERSRLGTLAREALRSAIKVARDRCEWSTVAERAERLVHLDPFDEAAYAEWMRALWMLGDRAAALERYNQLVAMLENELDARPSREVEELAERIRKRPVRDGWNQRLVREQEDPSPFRDPPFVGRKRELEILAREWDYVKAGETRAVALVGEAGIGKTRLAEHFMESLELDDCIVFRSRCYEAEQSVPYGPIGEAIRSALGEVDLEMIEPLWLAEVARIVPEVRARCGELPDPPALEAEGGRRRLYEGIAQTFRVVCEWRPVILFVDDLHWADESSVALIHYVLRRATSGLYLILAYRPEEDLSRHRSVDLVLPESSAAQALELQPLEDRDRSDLFLSLLGDSPDRELLRRLHHLSGGNPFFAIELAHSKPEQVQEERSPGASIPERIRSLLNRRFEVLGQPTLAVLEQAAFLGSRTTYRPLQLALGLPPQALEAHIRAAVRSGILRQEDRDTVCFRHDLIREVIKESVSTPRARELHARAARSLVRCQGNPGEVAEHLVAAGDPERGYRFALEAANRAERLYAFDDLAKFLNLALQCAPHPRDRARVQGRLGRLFWLLRDYERALPLLKERHRYVRSHPGSRAERIASHADLLFLRVNSGDLSAERSITALKALYARTATERGVNRELPLKALQLLFWASLRAGDRRTLSETLDTVRAIHAASQGDPAVRWRTARTLAINAAYAGTCRDAYRYAREALECSRQLDDAVAAVECYVALSFAAVRGLNLDLNREIMQVGIPLAEKLGDPRRHSMLLGNSAIYYLYLRQLDRAEALLEQQARLCDGVGDYAGCDASHYHNRGWLALLRGEAWAADSLRRALQLHECERRVSCSLDTISALGLVAVRAGEWDAAVAYAAKALRYVRRVGLYSDERDMLEELIARVRFQRGRTAKALKRLERIAAQARDRDMPLYLSAQLTRMELLNVSGQSELAQRVGKSLLDMIRSLDHLRWYRERANTIVRLAVGTDAA